MPHPAASWPRNSDSPRTVLETVGLPGLPKNWLEPSRIVALVLEALFVALAGYQRVTLRNRFAFLRR